MEIRVFVNRLVSLPQVAEDCEIALQCNLDDAQAWVEEFADK